MTAESLQWSSITAKFERRASTSDSRSSECGKTEACQIFYNHEVAVKKPAAYLNQFRVVLQHFSSKYILCHSLCRLLCLIRYSQLKPKGFNNQGLRPENKQQESEQNRNKPCAKFLQFMTELSC